jgi:hypothetical protein
MINNTSQNITIFQMLLLSTLLLFGCSSVDVKNTSVVEVRHESSDIPEQELLDVGIRIFSPGLDNIEQLDDDELVFPEIRLAEANFFPYLLMESMQSSSAWGAVRVVPMSHNSVEVIVSGHIVKSDGELMVLKINAVDATGRAWFSKEYSQKASKYSYDRNMSRRHDPFQNIYNRIANDLNSYRHSLSGEQKIAIRQVSEMKFAQLFAPQVFDGHVSENRDGRLAVNRLPARNDPMMLRIRQVRERDHIFIDTLQEHYDGYVKEMKMPYIQWRRESYNEVMSLRNMKSKARNQKLMGAAAILAGILGAGNGDAVVRAASAIGVAGGAYVLKAGYESSADAQIHIDALQELGDSLEASIESHVIELEDRTVTLTGTVENQYQQWREILKELYQLDVGQQ